MPSALDDYEIADAQEWDESANSSRHFDKTTSNENRAVVDIPTASAITVSLAQGGASRVVREQKSTHRGFPGTLRNSQRQIDLSITNVPRTGLSIIDDEKHQKSRLWSEWSKDHLISTFKQRQIEKMNYKKIREDQFLKQPSSHEGFYAASYYLWPYDDLDPDELLGDNLKSFNSIRKSCQTFIDYDTATRCLRIRSLSMERNKKALDQVDLALRSALANTDYESAMTLLIEPPSVAAMRSTVVPTFESIQGSTQKPIITKVTLSGMTLSNEEAARWVEGRDVLITENRHRLSQHLRTRLYQLNALQSGMRLRLHFGRMNMLHYPKNFATKAYSVTRFMEISRDPQVKARIDKRLGDSSLASKIKSLILLSPEEFSPADSISSSLINVKPRHSLVILARTPSNDMVRIEADLDEVFDTNGVTWQIGATHCYHQTERKTRLNIGVLGFESKYDWSMEIVSDDLILNVPRELQLLVRKLRNVTEKQDEFGLSYPWISPVSNTGIPIQQVWIRSIERYSLIGTKFILESAVYRRWDGTDTTANPSTDFGLALFHKDWDFVMSPTEANRDWGPELSNLFPGPSFEESLFHMLGNVREVQSFLDRDRK